jgi:HK97 family phage prohead protease
MSGIERRVIPAAELRVVRAKDGGQIPTIVGYAAVFNKRSVDLFGFYEEVAPGAFTDTLAAGDDVRALWNHDPNIVLGRTKSGTLALREDDTGLWCEITPPDTQQARDAVALIERGDVDQMSFSFRVLEDKWRIDADESYVRRLVTVKLYDVAPATFAAYPDTSIGVRSAGPHPLFGEIPVIPAEVKRALADAVDGGQVRAHLDALRRRVEIAELE